jgi:hypothetical protein
MGREAMLGTVTRQESHAPAGKRADRQWRTGRSKRRGDCDGLSILNQ